MVSVADTAELSSVPELLGSSSPTEATSVASSSTTSVTVMLEPSAVSLGLNFLLRIFLIFLTFRFDILSIFRDSVLPTVCGCFLN